MNLSLLSRFYTGKSSVASALAQHYGGTCLSVDNVVTAALMNGSSAVSLRARQLYDTAAAQYLERKVKEAGKYKNQSMH